MQRNEWLRFEIMIMDIAEELKIKDADSLYEFSTNLHEHIETALQDYADDMGFGEDYEPQF